MIHGQYTDYKHTCFAQICVANHIHKDIPPPYNLPLCKHIQTHSFNLISLLPNSNTAQATPQRRSPCDTNNLSSTHTHTHTHTQTAISTPRHPCSIIACSPQAPLPKTLPPARVAILSPPLRLLHAQPGAGTPTHVLRCVCQPLLTTTGPDGGRWGVWKGRVA